MILLLAAIQALAVEPVFVGTEKAGTEAEKPVTTLSAEFGGVWTTGNTDTFNLNGIMRTGHRWGKNRFKLDVGANLGQSYLDVDGDGRVDDEERDLGRIETARRYFGDARYDRFVSERDSLYVLAGSFIDPFAGYDNRAHVQAGFSRAIAKNETTTVLGELGADLAREDFVDGVVPNGDTILAVRGLVGISHRFNPNVTLSEQVEVFENVLAGEDLRVLSTGAITASLTNVLSLKLSHQLTFDNAPVEGFRKVDQTTMATFVATLLGGS